MNGTLIQLQPKSESPPRNRPRSYWREGASGESPPAAALCPDAARSLSQENRPHALEERDPNRRRSSGAASPKAGSVRSDSTAEVTRSWGSGPVDGAASVADFSAEELSSAGASPGELGHGQGWIQPARSRRVSGLGSGACHSWRQGPPVNGAAASDTSGRSGSRSARARGSSKEPRSCRSQSVSLRASAAGAGPKRSRAATLSASVPLAAESSQVGKSAQVERRHTESVGGISLDVAAAAGWLVQMA